MLKEFATIMVVSLKSHNGTSSMYKEKVVTVDPH